MRKTFSPELLGGMRLGGVEEGRSGEGEKHSDRTRAMLPARTIRPTKRRRRARRRQALGKRLRRRFMMLL